MNFFDIVTVIALVWAVVSGWRKGFVTQLLMLGGIVAGLVLAVRLGARVGDMLGIGEQFAAVAGMAVVFLAVLVVMFVLSFFLKRLLSLAAMRWLDVMLGISLSVIKTLLILCVCYSAFDYLNSTVGFVKKERLDKSVTYRPICGIGKKVVPVVDWAKAQIPALKEAGEKVGDLGEKALDKI